MTLATEPHCPSVRRAVTRGVYPRLKTTSSVLAEAQRKVERLLAHGCRDGTGVDLQAALRALPLLVQTAVRVHQRREGRGVLVWGLDVVGVSGRIERRVVVVAPKSGAVLLFSVKGVLDAAGWVSEQAEVEWDPLVAEHDWY